MATLHSTAPLMNAHSTKTFLTKIICSRNEADCSQRDVVVLLPGVLELLVAQHLTRAGDALARAVRHDHLVDIAPLRRDERISEARLILVDALPDLGLVAKLGAVEDLDCALRPHPRD